MTSDFIHTAPKIHTIVHFLVDICRSAHPHCSMNHVFLGVGECGRQKKHQGRRVKLKINVFRLNSMFERGKFRKTSPGPHNSSVCLCVRLPRHLSVLSPLSALSGGAGAGGE